MATDQHTAAKAPRSTVRHLRIVPSDPERCPAEVAARSFPALVRQDIRASRPSLADIRAVLKNDHGFEALQRDDGSWVLAGGDFTDKGLRAFLAALEFLAEVQDDGAGNMRDRMEA